MKLWPEHPISIFSFLQTHLLKFKGAERFSKNGLMQRLYNDRLLPRTAYAMKRLNVKHRVCFSSSRMLWLIVVRISKNLFCVHRPTKRLWLDSRYSIAIFSDFKKNAISFTIALWLSKMLHSSWIRTHLKKSFHGFLLSHRNFFTSPPVWCHRVFSRAR